MLSGKECFEIRDCRRVIGAKMLANMDTHEVLMVANLLHHNSPTRQALYDWQYQHRQRLKRPGRPPGRPPPKAA